jgi:hypothetical protein
MTYSVPEEPLEELPSTWGMRKHDTSIKEKQRNPEPRIFDPEAQLSH